MIDDEDESSPCIAHEVNGCDARIQPGESCDEDVPVCSDCYGEGPKRLRDLP